MAGLQTLHLAHLPPDLAVHIALYTDLQNASFLRDQLLRGNSDFEYAFVDADVILSTTHVLAAVFRAANDWLSGRLRSRNVHSEVVLSLGTNNNISHSLQTFGISPSTTSLLVIKLSLSTPDITASSISTHLTTHVKGSPASFDDETLKGLADVEKIRRVYKLGGGEGKGGRKRKDGSVEGSGSKGGNGEADEREEERERKELEVAVLGLMALRGAV